MEAIKVLDDGQFIVAGWTEYVGSPNGKQFFLQKHGTAGGGLFSTPAFNGRSQDLSLGDDIAYDIAVQTDGRILLAGQANGMIAAARFDTQGWLDPSFGDQADN